MNYKIRTCYIRGIIHEQKYNFHSLLRLSQARYRNTSDSRI